MKLSYFVKLTIEKYRNIIGSNNHCKIVRSRHTHMHALIYDTHIIKLKIVMEEQSLGDNCKLGHG